MANESSSPPEQLDFHPCDTPRGMTYYKLQELTDRQREQLFDQKLDIVRANQVYLKEHPEIRTVIDILLKAILKARPKVKLRYFLAKYFTENYDEIKAAMERFATEQEEDGRADEVLEWKLEEPAEEAVHTPSEESKEPSLLCILDDDMAFDYPNLVMQTHPSAVSGEDVYLICRQILNDIVEYVCKDDIEQQIKQFSRLTSSDSDPLLAFPFEPYLSDDDINADNNDSEDD